MHWWQMAHAKTSVGDTCGAAGVAGGRLDSQKGGRGAAGWAPQRFSTKSTTHRFPSMNFFVGVGKPLNNRWIFEK